MSENNIDKLAEIIWDYHLMHQSLRKANAIFALGTHDPLVAEYAVDLYLNGWAPFLIFSGGTIHEKDTLKNMIAKPEAEAFYDIAIKRGVPKEAIIVENKASNTGENFKFTEELLKALGFQFKTFIVVQKPYMERRTYATAKVHWPDKELIVTSKKQNYLDYVRTSGIPKDRIINTMVGDLQRIKIYPDKGFQIYQEIPDSVWDAYEELVKFGYNKRVIK